MPSSDRYIHFFFLSFFAISTAWTCTQTIPSNISLKITDQGSVWSFQLTSEAVFFFLNSFCCKNDNTASLHTCIKTEISTVFSETSSFKEKLINTDCVGVIGAEKHPIADAASGGEILQLKYGDIIAVKLLKEAHKTEYYTDCLDRKRVRICRNTWTVWVSCYFVFRLVITGRLDATFHSQSRERREDEELLLWWKRRRSWRVFWMAQRTSWTVWVGECKSFPTGALMKLRLIKHFITSEFAIAAD